MRAEWIDQSRLRIQTGDYGFTCPAVHYSVRVAREGPHVTVLPFSIDGSSVYDIREHDARDMRKLTPVICSWGDGSARPIFALQITEGYFGHEATLIMVDRVTELHWIIQALRDNVLKEQEAA